MSIERRGLAYSSDSLMHILRILTRLYAMVAMLVTAFAMTLVLESLGIFRIYVSQRAYRLAGIFFLIGLPSVILVVTMIAFVSKAAIDWVKRNS